MTFLPFLTASSLRKDKNFTWSLLPRNKRVFLVRTVMDEENSNLKRYVWKAMVL